MAVPESTCSHRSLTYTHADSTRGPCGHAKDPRIGREEIAVLPTFRVWVSFFRLLPNGNSFGPRSGRDIGRAGGQWLILDVVSTGITSGAIGDASRRRYEPR